MTVFLYSFTLLLSALLVFVVQPLVGKQILPILGGTPSVWNVCLVFFQGSLLVGYYYAHFLQRLSPRWQVLVHLVNLGLAAVSLLAREPLLADAGQLPTDSDTPIVRLLLVLASMVGWPFVVLSSTAPLLQRWFSWHGQANPYWLYVTSNVGSLGGLIAYPLFFEEYCDLDQQRFLWAWGYVAVGLLMMLCGFLVPKTAMTIDSHSPEPIPLRQWLKWVVLAAFPSSWLMAVTSHLTTDIAPIPLLWVIPLTLYLITFIITFAYWPQPFRVIFARAVPMLLMFLLLVWLTHATEPLLLIAGIHLLVFFVVTLLCHGELSATRPLPAQLTRFYFALSLGGVLGGVFNAVLAPLLFAKLGLIEYPLLMLAIVFIRPDVSRLSLNRVDLGYLLLWATITLGLMFFIPRVLSLPTDPDDPDALLKRVAFGGLTVGVPVVLLFALVWNPLRFSIAVLLMLLMGQLLLPSQLGETLHVSRNFFGTLRVTRSLDGQYIQLVHGTTQHGQQKINEADRPQPRMYYHATGPIGRVFQKLPPERKRRVGLVGLGCGALAAYSQPGQQWSCFEIDPGVVRLANDERYFTFLKQSAAPVRIVLGDARRQLMKEPDQSYDLLVLDAFSSDAIPTHLLTREAFELYAHKLAPEGVIALHLSNRYLHLPPLVQRVGESLQPAFQFRLDEDVATDRERADGKFSSTWAILFRQPDHLGDLAKDLRFQNLSAKPGPIWTDRSTNLLSVWKE